MRLHSSAAQCGRGSMKTRMPLRIKAAEGPAVVSTTSVSPSVQSTLDALDSLLPPEQVKEQQQVTPQPAASSSQQPVSRASSTSSNSSSTGGLSSWINLPPATRSPSNPALDKQLRTAHQEFEKVMAFDGLAPEIVNGRAAMLGFVAALAGEIHGASLFSQLMAGGAAPAVAVMLLVTLASFAPAVRQVPMDKVFGKDKQPATFGPFTPDAELRNGRAAMLGVLMLVFIEGSSSTAFFM